MSRRNSNSIFESSDSSSNEAYFTKDSVEFPLSGDPIPQNLRRTSTVRRASGTSAKRDLAHCEESDSDASVSRQEKYHPGPSVERYRRSLDSTYRRSLESIHEYKPKHSFSSCSLYHSRASSSIDSPSSELADFATRCSSEQRDSIASNLSSNYLSWIESIHNTFGISPADNDDVVYIDNKVGEWNNFWLNYNSTQNRYLSSNGYQFEDKTGDDVSDTKSTCSTHKEFNEKMSSEQIMLGIDEVMEVLSCAQKISDILHKALKRSDDVDQSRHDSCYSNVFSRRTGSLAEETRRERLFSFFSDRLESPKARPLKPTQSENSCINTLLTSGVADIFKRVMYKKRDSMQDDAPSTTRSSFSDWTNSK